VNPTQRYYRETLKGVIGSTVVEAGANDEGAPYLIVQHADGSRDMLVAMMDDEGNGPGALWCHANRPATHATRPRKRATRCPDCGAEGERKGHQTCQYPRD
jgi:hypothetical protein